MNLITRIRSLFGTHIERDAECHDLFTLINPDEEGIPLQESQKRVRRLKFFEQCRKGTINSSIKGSEIDFSKIDLPQMFGVIAATSGMKDQQWRMFRGTVCEKALEKYSGGQLKYVGDKENGMDFIDANGVRYECKSQDDIFNDLPSQNGKKSSIKDIRSITLINFLGQVREIERTFDYLIMICNSTFSMGIISWEDMKDHITVHNDSIKVKIPKEKITMISEGVVPVCKEPVTPSNILDSVFDRI